MRNLHAFCPLLLTGLLHIGLSQTTLAGSHFTVRLKEPGRLNSPTVHTIRFSPDGGQLAVAHDGKVSFIRPHDGELTGKISFQTRSMAYSQDGSQLLLIGYRERRLLDVNFGTAQTFEARPEPGFIGVSLERRNGKLLISRLLPGGPAALTKQIQEGDELTGVGHGREGSIVSVTGDLPEQAVRLIAGTAGTELRLTTIPRGQLSPQTHLLTRFMKTEKDGDVAYAPPESGPLDGQLAYRVLYDFVEFSSTRTGRVVTRLPLRAAVAASETAGSSDSKFLAAIREVDLPRRDSESEPEDEDESESRRFVPITASVVESVRDNVVAGRAPRRGYVADVYDVATRNLIQSVPVETEDVFSLVPVPVFHGLSFSSDGQKLVVATWSRLTVYDVATGRRERVITPSEKDSIQPVHSFAVSSRIAATGCAGGLIRVCDYSNGDILRSIHVPANRAVTHMTLSPDSGRLACYVDGVIHVVDISDVQTANGHRLQTQTP